MTVRSPARIFAVPLMIGVLSAIGLTAALLGDGVWDAVSWLALGVPVVVAGRYGIRRR
jgi:hypothetical protein